MENLKTISTEELAHVVELFPWFAAARVELCSRVGQKEDAALYVASRSILAGSDREDVTDPHLEEVISKAPEKRVYVVGGDFFSQAQYDEVRSDTGADAPSFRGVTPVSEETVKAIAQGTEDEFSDEFCTETLAQIYAEQGYPDQAKYIYSKLGLRYP